MDSFGRYPRSMSTRAEKIEDAAREVMACGGYGMPVGTWEGLCAALALPPDPTPPASERERALVRAAYGEGWRSHKHGHDVEVSDDHAADMVRRYGATHPRAPSVEAAALPSWIVAARDKEPEGWDEFLALCCDAETDTLIKCITEGERVYVIDAARIRAHAPVAQVAPSEPTHTVDLLRLRRLGACEEPIDDDYCGLLATNDARCDKHQPGSGARPAKRCRLPCEYDTRCALVDGHDGRCDPTPSEGDTRAYDFLEASFACPGCGLTTPHRHDAHSAPRDQGGGLREWFSRVLRNAAERGLIVSQDETGIDAALAEVGPPPPTDGVAAAYERAAKVCEERTHHREDPFDTARDLAAAIRALAPVSEKERAK